MYDPFLTVRPSNYYDHDKQDFEVPRFSGVSFSRKTGKPRIRLTTVQIDGESRQVLGYGPTVYCYLTQDDCVMYKRHLDRYVKGHPVTGPKMAAAIAAAPRYRHLC